MPGQQPLPHCERPAPSPGRHPDGSWPGGACGWPPAARRGL